MRIDSRVIIVIAALVFYNVSPSKSEPSSHQVTASTQTAQGSEQSHSRKKWIWWAVAIAAVAGIIYAIASSSGGGSSGGGKGY